MKCPDCTDGWYRGLHHREKCGTCGTCGGTGERVGWPEWCVLIGDLAKRTRHAPPWGIGQLMDIIAPVIEQGWSHGDEAVRADIEQGRKTESPQEFYDWLQRDRVHDISLVPDGGEPIGNVSHGPFPVDAIRPQLIGETTQSAISPPDGRLEFTHHAIVKYTTPDGAEHISHVVLTPEQRARLLS